MRPEDILGSDPPLDDGPPPWTWEEYMAWLEPAWGRLLDERPDECDMQRFLEEHPCLLPGAFPMWGSSAGGHGAFPKACVTQPPLQGLGKRIPDFLWIARDSAFLRPVFIEIEDPKKRWFGKRRQQSADLTQALEQIREWREWFNSPANQQVFLDAYAIPLEWRSRKFKPTFVLVYGLASEGRVEIGRLRAHHGADDFVLTTFDHLWPEPKTASYLTARSDGAGSYAALSMPPTARFSPEPADFWVLISGRERAVTNNPLISKDRKAFLLSRLAEWDEWARDDVERREQRRSALT